MTYIIGEHPANSRGESAITQIEDVATRAHRTALMADGHFGYIMPIGGIDAYQNKVSVAGVGFDSACGRPCPRVSTSCSPASMARPHRRGC